MAANPESILDSIKKPLGLDPEFVAFDLDIIMHINSAFGELIQLGVGADTGFRISDNTTLWSQYASDLSYQGMVKQYIYLKTRLGFDPPATSFAIDSVRKLADELAFRILAASEHAIPPAPPVVETEEEGWVPIIVQVPFSAVVTPNAAMGNIFYLTLEGDCTINAPIFGVDGQHITFDLTSKGHVVTWGPGWNFGLLGTPVLTADKTDIISAYYRLTTNEWVAGFTAGF